MLHIGHALTVVALHSGLLPSDVVPYALTRDVWQPALAECRVCVEDSFLPTHSSSPCTGIGALAGSSAPVCCQSAGEGMESGTRAQGGATHRAVRPGRAVVRRPVSCVTPIAVLYGARFSSRVK